jgi:phosphatidylethanolamine-binding protein (PEBP) family uncharacterized protein
MQTRASSKSVPGRRNLPGIEVYGSVGGAAEPFTWTSSAFNDGTPLQKKNSNNTQGNANWVGENVSPPLTWSNPPAGTKSFALTMVDPEGRAERV